MARNGTLAKSQELQPSFQTTTEQITIGIDLGDRFSHCCVLGPDGKILTEGRLRSTPETMARHFKDLPPSRIAIEVGTHSRWLSQLLAEWGHEVIVANPRNLRMIADSIRKSDQVDAHMLARLARVDPKLLSPIAHRKQEIYPDRQTPNKCEWKRGDQFHTTSNDSKMLINPQPRKPARRLAHHCNSARVC